MTAIAYRDGVLAADSRINYDAVIELKVLTKKISRFGDWHFGASGGECPKDNDIALWLFEGSLRADKIDYNPGPFKKPGKKWSFIVMLVRKGHPIYVVNEKGLIEEFNTPFMAIGSGGHICLGAMERGATAEEAVEIACLWCPNCELPVHKEVVL